MRTEVAGDTSGSARTSAGVPSAITTPGLEAVDAVAHRHHQRHVVLDEQHRGAERALDLAGCAARTPRSRVGDRPAVGSSSSSTRAPSATCPRARPCGGCRSTATPPVGRRWRRARGRRGCRRPRRASRARRAARAGGAASTAAGASGRDLRARPSPSRARSGRRRGARPGSVRPSPSAVPAVRGQAGDVATQHLDPPVGGDEPADRVHQRALARAVGADEPDELVRADPHVDVGRPRPAPEPHRDPRRDQPVPRRHVETRPLHRRGCVT